MFGSLKRGGSNRASKASDNESVVSGETDVSFDEAKTVCGTLSAFVYQRCLVLSYHSIKKTSRFKSPMSNEFSY